MSESFSVFETAQEALKARGVDSPAPVDLGRAEAKPGVTTRFTGTTESLLAWCRHVESTVIDRAIPGASVFAGFERYSRARFVADRYQRLGGIADALHLFGQPDWAIPFPTTRTHPIETGPLLREWFLIVSSERFVGMLSARDLDGLDTSVSPRKRRFEGLITHHPKTILEIVDALSDAFEIG